jgi:hypothetical protein
MPERVGHAFIPGPRAPDAETGNDRTVDGDQRSAADETGTRPAQSGRARR